MTSDGADRINVRVANTGREPGAWVELRDDSASSSANLRQLFGPVVQGRFSLRLLPAGDHNGGIGIYLGTGTASVAADRVIDIKISDAGVVRLGSRASRKSTPLEIRKDVVTRLWVEWQPTSAGTLEVHLGTSDADGADTEVARFNVPDPAPISALRITTDISPVGGHFFVGNLVLTES